jgi:hypothetical protein
MVGYNDAYNRALTARSNALQRRKGQMIDRLNGSGRGDEDSEEDDYLSDEGMEGGAAYEDDYEDEMVGGSFEEASREVGGSYGISGGFNSVGGRPTGGRPTGGRATGGFLPMFLASAAAPLVGSLVSKLFGGAYTGGARKVKSAMMRDLMGSGADERLKPAFPIFTDMAYKVGNKVMKAKGGYGLTGGRQTGGKMTGGNPLLAALAMGAAPALGQAFGKLFGLGKQDPIMRGAGFFDDLWSKIKQIPSDIARVVSPIATAAAPYIKQGAVWAKDNLLPIAVEAGKEALKQKLTPAKGKGMTVGVGRAKCCSACKGSGMTIGVGKKSPYDLAYGGAMRAQTAFDREDERIGMEVRGLKDAERRNKEKNYALGAGGKRLYMSGGQANVAAMGQESLYGYDNDEQGEGLMPPRNVATRGYMSGCGAMPMYSCGGRKRNMKMLPSGYALGTPDAMEGVGMAYGGRALTPKDQMRPTIGGRATGGRASAWITHVKAYAAKHGVSYKDALKSAAATYRS